MDGRISCIPLHKALSYGCWRFSLCWDTKCFLGRRLKRQHKLSRKKHNLISVSGSSVDTNKVLDEIFKLYFKKTANSHKNLYTNVYSCITHGSPKWK